MGGLNTLWSCNKEMGLVLGKRMDVFEYAVVVQLGKGGGSGKDMMTHTGDKPMSHTHGKTFIVVVNLKKHILKHAGDKLH